MALYYIKRDLFGIVIRETVEDDNEYRFKIKDSSKVRLNEEELIKKVQELREQGENVEVWYRKRGRKRPRYYKKDI